jgi:hypothetical protein
MVDKERAVSMVEKMGLRGGHLIIFFGNAGKPIKF